MVALTLSRQMIFPLYQAVWILFTALGGIITYQARARARARADARVVVWVPVWVRTTSPSSGPRAPPELLWIGCASMQLE